MLRDRLLWKFLFLQLFVAMFLGVLAVDLENPTEPAWNVLLNSIRPTLSQQYGAKAAVLAIVGAGIVFVGLIPGRSNKLSKTIDLVVKIAGSFSVMVIGWFWLLGETDGRPGPYLVAFIPTVGTLMVVMLVLFPFNLPSSKSIQQGETGKETSSDLGPFVFGIVAILLGIAFFYALIFVPRWLF